MTEKASAVDREWPRRMTDAPTFVPNERGYRERHWEQARQVEMRWSQEGRNGLPEVARLLYVAEIAEKSTGCARSGCCMVNAPWQTFTTRDGKTWCLGHMPLRARVRVWWQERRNA
jgi:hypothetical protein